jgi:hypothetical protein
VGDASAGIHAEVAADGTLGLEPDIETLLTLELAAAATATATDPINGLITQLFIDGVVPVAALPPAAVGGGGSSLLSPFTARLLSATVSVSSVVCAEHCIAAAAAAPVAAPAPPSPSQPPTVTPTAPTPSTLSPAVAPMSAILVLPNPLHYLDERAELPTTDVPVRVLEFVQQQQHEGGWVV